MWLDHLPAPVRFGGSASLSTVCRHIKLARAGDLHDAIEDGSRCRSTFGCTAARFRVDCAARSLAFHPISVTLRSAHTISIDKGRTGPACPSSEASKSLPLLLHTPNLR